MKSDQFIEDITQPDTFVEIQVKNDSTTNLATVDPELNEYISKFVAISADAQGNEKAEKAMTLMEGIRTFPKAVAWSVMLSTAIIMEGYDTNLLNSLYSFPGFNQKYGEFFESIGKYQIPAKWQTSLSMAVNCGEIVGLFAAGIIADRFGYRKTLIGALCFTIAFIFIVFFSINIEMLLAGEILMGVPWGVFQTLTISYASEVCPLVLRVYLTTYVNACWVIGQLLASGVLKGLLSSSDPNAFRIAFGLQWIWPVPIIIGIYFAPESPFWLTKKGKLQEAKHSIKRLLSPNEKLPNVNVLAEAMVNRIQLTLKEEEQISSSATYMDCFRNGNFRRTRIASLVWVFQNLTGSALMGYSTYFYLQAGLSESMSFTFSIIQYVLGLLGMLTTWSLSQKFGRFDIYFGGLVINFFVLIIVGGLSFSHTGGASWGIGSLLLVFTFVYDATIGPITYCVVTEIPSSRLRTKTVIIARNLYNVAGIIVAIITPYMLNPTAWNWKAKTGFFWAGFALSAIIWAWFEFPETKGRTYAELDRLFKDGVNSRNFKKTKVEVFNTQELIDKLGDDAIKAMVDANKTVVEKNSTIDLEEQSSSNFVQVDEKNARPY